tara:strand:- start:112 stop:723 length:612 start_codon:yes stop_codon:yes gene_type:complete
MENFIRQYDNVISDNGCNHLMKMLDQQVVYSQEEWDKDNDEHRALGRQRGQDLQDTQMTIDPYFPNVSKEICEDVINNAFKYYCQDFPYLSERGDWLSGAALIQKTIPTQGFHNWHCENSGFTDADRWVTWMVYLNDVEEGGETEFLHQSLRIKPKKGMGVIWPGGYTHIHRGNSPLKGEKYILTGWFTLTVGMNTFKMNPDA